MMQSYGRVALELTLAGVGGKLPRSNLGYLAELLLAFSRRLPNETRVWLKEAFSRVNHGHDAILFITAAQAEFVYRMDSLRIEFPRKSRIVTQRAS